MDHDPLCPCTPIDPIRPGAVHTSNSASCLCVLIAKVRADEHSRRGVCWRETAEGVEIPAGAIRVYREAGWFWEMP